MQLEQLRVTSISNLCQEVITNMKLNNLLSRGISRISNVRKLKSRKLIVDIIWNTASTGIIKLRGFILAPVISYFCGLEWYGAWVLIYALTRYTLPFSTLLLPNAIVRFFLEEKEIRDEIYSFCLLSTFVYSLIISFLIAWNVDFLSIVFLKDIYFSNLLLVGSFLTIIVSLERMIGSYFRARDNIKMSSTIEALSSVVEVASISLVLAFTRNLVFAVATFLIIIFLIEAVIAIKVLNISALKTALSKAVLLKYYKYVKYSLPLVSTSLTEIFASNGDRFIVAYFLGAKFVGIYSIAYALGSSIMVFCGPIVYSLFPKVSRLWASGNTIEAKALLQKSTKAFLVSGAIFFFIVLVFGNQLLMVLAGRETDILKENGLIVSLIVMTGVLLYGSSRIQSLYFLLINETKLEFIVYLVTVIINLVFNIILIPKIGILGAALATLIAYMIGLMFVIFFINRGRTKEIIANVK